MDEKNRNNKRSESFSDGNELSSVQDADFLQKPKFSHFPVRIRAHLNPLSDSQRLYRGEDSSDRTREQVKQAMKAISRYNDATKSIERRWLDLGCAFGGLIFELLTLTKDVLLIGLEIRPACTQYCYDKIKFLSEQMESSNNRVVSPDNMTSTALRNLHFINCNVMRDLGRVVKGQSIEKAFITYPDPHFKVRNVRRRLLSERMIPVIAYVLRRVPKSLLETQESSMENGKLYIATDVKELIDWMKSQMNAFPNLFSLVDQGEILSSFDSLSAEEKQMVKSGLFKVDRLLPSLIFSSEDAQRCTRRKIDRFWAIYERV